MLAQGSRWIVLACVLAVGMPGGIAEAHPGDIDPTFSTDGMAQFSFGRALAPGEYLSSPVVSPVGFEPDGDLVVAGTDTYASNCSHSLGCTQMHPYILLARVQPDGSLDPGFNGGTVLETDLGLGGAMPRAFAVQPDGRILAVVGRGTDPIVARLMASGALDPTFSDDGMAELDLPGNQQINAIAVDDSGGIVLGGRIDGAQIGYQFYNQDDLLVRLKPDGSLDAGFGSDGVAISDFTREDEIVRIAFDDQNRIVVAGTAAIAEPFGLDLGIARFTPDGKPDPAFSGDGHMQLDLLPDRNSNENVTGFGIAPGGRPVVLATSFPDDTVRGEFYTVDVVRLTASGDLDPSLGSGGIREIPEFGQAGGVMTVLPDGEMLVAGFDFRGLLLARLLQDGDPDPTFGTGGWTRLYPRTGVPLSTPLVAGDGRIFTTATSFETPPRILVARFRGDAQPPDDADADGTFDPADACPGVYAPGDGCPHDTLEVQLRWRDDSIGGRITSTSSFCLTADVLVYRKQQGNDPRVARWRADDSRLHEPFVSPAESQWGKARPGRHGRFYARIKPHFDPTVGYCGGARSRTVTVR